MAKNLIKMPLENRVNPVVLRERGGKIMMIMMVAVARYFDGSWLWGHSTTTWAKFYPIMTTYPSGADILHTTYHLFTWPSVDFLLTTATFSCLRSHWMTPSLASAAKILRNFPYLTSSGLPRRTFDTLVTRVDTLVSFFKVCSDLLSYFIHKMLNVVGSFNVKNMNIHQTF